MEEYSNVDYEKLFKIWYIFIWIVSIASTICMVIGLMKKNDILTWMPMLALAIIVVATYLRDLIARESHKDDMQLSKQ